MPPNGSYYDLSDTDATGIVQHDKVYEGSLRSAIGTLLLAKNDIKGAIAELELAVVICFVWRQLNHMLRMMRIIK